MKYRIVQEIHGHIIKSEVNESGLYAAMEIRGYKFQGINSNQRQRVELQGQPIFEGLLGPMWDGDAIRYEDESTYALLSR